MKLNMTSKKIEIQKLAAKELKLKGINGFSFRELAASVGIKSSSVHYHFKSKRDLLKVLVIEYRKELLSALKKIEENSHSLKESLIAVVNYFEKALDKNELCVCGILAAEKNLISEDIIIEIKATFSELEKWIKAMISNYSDNTIPEDALTAILISSIEGSLLLDRLNGDRHYFNTLKLAVKHFTVN